MLTIEEDQLSFFVDNNFKVEDMALILGCSKRTVERRLGAYNLSTRSYSTLTDAELDNHVKDICNIFPRCGEKMIHSRLRVQGIRIQRERARESIHRVDPSGVQARMRRVLRRRSYHVESPNSLWHLDGHHKLIRWKLVIHGGIDGYSRLITFLRVSGNNRAETVLSAFLKAAAVDEFGISLPSGGENMLVAHYMLAHPREYNNWKKYP